jgi:hypothetical protein
MKINKKNYILYEIKVFTKILNIDEKKIFSELKKKYFQCKMKA